jgi:ABC-type enterochelin transport system permease subunit
MEALKQTSTVIGQLIDIGLALLALAIVLSLLIGGTLPFFGSVVDNIIALVNSLGNNGLVGLIGLGIILWLFGRYV